SASPPPSKIVTSLRLCLSSTLQNYSFRRCLPSPDPATPPVLSFRRTRHSALPLLHSSPQPRISSPPILCSTIRPLPLPFLVAPPRTKTQKLKNPDLFDLVGDAAMQGARRRRWGSEFWIYGLVGAAGGLVTSGAMEGR
ncbi:unnamed protein product, partial [Linum tenue]